MAWCSCTRVARVPQAEREAIWRRIRASASGASHQLPKPVCCYALQGSCYFGPGTCEFSHELGRVRLVGCQFGPKCRLGHAATVELRPDEAARSCGTGPGTELLDSAQARGGLAYMECHGPSFDDSDPLWDELSCALREAAEDTGDSDLPGATRDRLAAADQYHLLDEDTADEWLCIPAVTLQQHLVSAREGVAQSRRLWLGDDLGDARVLWEEVSGALRCRMRESGGQNVAGGALQQALGQAETALQSAWALKPGGDAAHGLAAPAEGARACGPLDVFTAAAGAVRALQQAASDSAADQLADDPSEGSEDFGRLSEDEVRGKLIELERCFERCAFLAHALTSPSAWQEPERAGCGDGSEAGNCATPGAGREQPAVLELAVGKSVEVTGLTTRAEQALNGREGQLERYDEALKLWQVQLAASGTRLLLGEEQVLPVRRAAAAPAARGRSRSPRRPDGPRSILELTQDAAQHGEHVLVHHVVAWYGSEALACSL